MPQVPYTPVPGEGPAGRGALPGFAPTPPAHISVNEDMFGANVGRALREYGTTIEQAGGELFSRGQAMLDVKNQADADAAMVNFAKWSGQKHAEFLQLQGANASPEALAKFNDEIEKGRQQFGQGLSVMGQQHYNADSRRIVISQINSAAGHAGEQLRVYNDDTARSRLDMNAQLAAANPDEQKVIDDALADNRRLVEGLRNQWGWSDDKFNDELYKANAKTYARQLDSLSESNPARADRIFKEHRGELGEFEAPIAKKIDDRLQTIWSRNIAGEVVGGNNFELGNRVQPTEKVMAALREMETGTDIARGRDPYAHVDVETKHGHALGAYGVMSEFLPEELKRVGMPSATESEFLASKEMQDEYARRRINQIQSTGTANDVASIWISGKRFADAKPSDPADHYGSNGISYTRKFNQVLAGKVDLRDLTDLARTRAERELPDHPTVGDAAVMHVEHLYGEKQREEKQTVFNSLNQIEGALLKTDPTGKIPGTVDELLAADPANRAAWDQLPNPTKLMIQGKMYQLNRQEGRWGMTPEGASEIDKVRGMLQSGDPETVQKGLDYNVLGMHVPASEMLKLLGEKRRVLQGVNADPQINKMMTWLEPSLNSVGISHKDDPDTYNTVKGALLRIMEDRLAAHEDIKFRDVQEIGQNLIKDVITKQHHWWGSEYDQKDILAKAPIPDEAREAITKDFQLNHNGREPTDLEAAEIYLAQRYQTMYGRRPEGAPSGRGGE